ncbi:hypothetical protein Ana3638_11740 [Anaerocolumna sedimenticola]|uniref:Uncharacterized protein n=1 Tax=Anaerocolumna sedimenticola TaxID=2696063 RepID=A0A6P1TN98_9FIRM|nr:hypothetical protein [Anaerocolumna sedimenticola]QHQ61361.1 hypothetical protein Ana3638_11740 [Anaerocolumna sedimenticola]
MKQKYKSRLQAFLVITFFLALLYVFGVAGSLELDRLTVRQALVSGGIGCAYMAVSVITYKYIGKEE